MISSEFSLAIDDSKFLNNTASPILTANPLTNSGTGGALYVQTAKIFINSSEFVGNYVFTGQFDAGAGGGAIALEDSYPVDIIGTTFMSNGASGYVGYSTFAMPGAGGAIYIKFSSANFQDCDFENNWASAAGFDNSIGGAIAGTFTKSVLSMYRPILIYSHFYMFMMQCFLTSLMYTIKVHR
jgi:hypothetical protein